MNLFRRFPNKKKAKQQNKNKSLFSAIIDTNNCFRTVIQPEPTLNGRRGRLVGSGDQYQPTSLALIILATIETIIVSFVGCCGNHFSHSRDVIVEFMIRFVRRNGDVCWRVDSKSFCFCWLAAASSVPRLLFCVPLIMHQQKKKSENEREAKRPFRTTRHLSFERSFLHTCDGRCC